MKKVILTTMIVCATSMLAQSASSLSIVPTIDRGDNVVFTVVNEGTGAITGISQSVKLPNADDPDAGPGKRPTDDYIGQMKARSISFTSTSIFDLLGAQQKRFVYSSPPPGDRLNATKAYYVFFAISYIDATSKKNVLDSCVWWHPTVQAWQECSLSSHIKKEQ